VRRYLTSYLQAHPWQTHLLLLALLALIGALDAHTGPAVSLLFFYALPVLAATWLFGGSAGYQMTLLVIGVWGLLAWRHHVPQTHPVLTLWNLLMVGATLLLVSYLLHSRQQQAHRAQQLAQTDELTGLLNRRHLLTILEQEIARARRQSLPLSVIYLDLDGFKALNDTQGHAVGDAALQRISALMRAEVRLEDTIARLGGDEFVLLLSNAGVEEGRALAQRLQARLAGEAGIDTGSLTAAIGVATFTTPPASVDQALQVADHLMYAAKRQGPGVIVGRCLPTATDDEDWLWRLPTAREPLQLDS
jgi:diguanylate cyclase (GGDEF)-like protein